MVEVYTLFLHKMLSFEVKMGNTMSIINSGIKSGLLMAEIL